MNPIIESIRLNINGEKIDLTPDQAKSLRDQLIKTLGEVPIIPQYIILDPCRYTQPRPWWDQITCGRPEITC